MTDLFRIDAPEPDRWLDLRDLRLVAITTLVLALLAAVVPAAAQNKQVKADGYVPGPSRDQHAPSDAQRTGAAQAFAAKLRALFPETRIDEVRPTETSGLYEVVMGPNIAYIDASGRYWTFGHRYDMVERRDVTAPRLAAITGSSGGAAPAIDTGTLPIAAALKTVRGNGRRVLHVFADPNCGYCKQLELGLAQVSDITVYTYLLPILSLDSVDKAAAIWCAADRGAAWQAWMLKGVAPTGARDCPTPADKVAAAARRLRIDATPTLIAADGRKALGAMPPEELVAWLDAGDGAATGQAASVKTQVIPN